jgi:electron transport complex protein RnfA
MNALPLSLFVIFSGLSMNLMLQCGLGVEGAASSSSSDQGLEGALVKLGMIFVSVLLLWVFFAKIISVFSAEVFVYVLLFPLASMAYDGFEYVTCHFILEKEVEKDCYISFCSGITAAALFVCLNIADSFVQAASLSFGFVSGIFLSFIIIREIRKRAVLESVPRYIRGRPLILICMGLLSLIFTASALLLYRMLESV